MPIVGAMAAMEAQAEAPHGVTMVHALCRSAESAWHGVQSLAGLGDGVIDPAMTIGLVSMPPASKVKTRKYIMSRFISLNISVRSGSYKRARTRCGKVFPAWNSLAD